MGNRGESGEILRRRMASSATVASAASASVWSAAASRAASAAASALLFLAVFCQCLGIGE